MSTPPRMSLVIAWHVLGRDAVMVLNSIKQLKTREERINAAVTALEGARKTARTLMATHHPDKNPGDETARSRFQEVTEALACVEHHTEELKRKSQEIVDRALERRDGFIEIKK